MALYDDPHTFKFSNGDVKLITPEMAEKHAKDNDIKITWSGYDKAKQQIYGGIKDGFKPGYQPHLGNRWIGGPREYARVLKEMGLIEMGKGYHKPEFTKEINLRDDLNLFRELSQAGMSDREIDAWSREEI
jgi:hypothetical protein